MPGPRSGPGLEVLRARDPPQHQQRVEQQEGPLARSAYGGARALCLGRCAARQGASASCRAAGAPWAGRMVYIRRIMNKPVKKWLDTHGYGRVMTNANNKTQRQNNYSFEGSVVGFSHQGFQKTCVHRSCASITFIPPPPQCRWQSPHGGAGAGQIRNCST